MKNVLICLSSMRRGGIEMSALSFQQNMNKEKWNFTYYIRDNKNFDEDLVESLISENNKLVFKPDYIKSRFEEYRWIRKYLIENHYDVVHSHMQFYSGLVLAAASKVKKRIVHSHFSKNNRRIGFAGFVYRKIMRVFILLFSTDMLACSLNAGKFLYGKRFCNRGNIINNGIDISRYIYNDMVRQITRGNLNIGMDMLIIGHIGSIYWIKNQEFLIKIFYEIKKIKPNSVLLLCGEERDDGKVRLLVNELNLEKSVKFLGVRRDIPELLMAMDILVFPSLFEAQPIVPIEAQATGLPCLLSDRIIPEIKNNKNVEFISLEESPEIWARKAIELSECDRESVSTEELKKNYDIKKIAEQLEKIYES